ncbi:MAG: DUF3048 C-terminal domain-containing protein [Anaerolineaceae bacterium]|nr:DUF3048 C-terminal domain-containing protein [Anaerolineaceae bacterium]
MKKRLLLVLSTLIILTLILSACKLPFTLPQVTVEEVVESETAAPTEESTESVETATEAPTEEVLPTETEMPEVPEEAAPTEEPQASGFGTYGPTNFPEGINPLTGLATDPELLKLPPALVSVSNFPASARPQSGLNTSPMVFEITIGEGMTRFLAMFYGAYPQMVSGLTEGQGSGEPSGDGSGDSSGDSGALSATGAASIGPIRSGRLPYEDIRSLFSGFLVMASAYSGVAQNLSETTNIFGSDSDDINSALIDVSQLYNIALSRSESYPGSNFNLDGMKFSPDIPEGGKEAETVWLFYSNLNQIQWRYDEELGAYIRYDIKTDGSGEFVMSTDRLDGKPITRENVIVLYAIHTYHAPTLIDIALTNMPLMKALLFRDGQVFEINWTTQFGEYEKETGLLRPIRYVDENGDPVALKNGLTWVEVMSTTSFAVESEISEYPFFPIKEADGTGLWLVRYKGLY